MDTDKLVETARAIILLVDDDPGNLAVLGRLLHPHYDVLAAPSGERALQIAAGARKPDLILLDVLMPGMDGYDVLVRLHDNPATRDIPVIFVTGLDSAADEEHGLELGAVDYIAKPYHPPIILARVRTQLELKRARDFLADHNRILEQQVAARTAELRASEARFRVAMESVRDAFIILEPGQGTILEWNPAAATIFGYSREEMIGQPLHEFITPLRYREAARQGLEHFAGTGEGAAIGKTLELVALHKDGEEFPIELSLSAMLLGDKWHAAGVARDITERKRYQEQLERQANFDDLTGLPNRNLLTDRLVQAITRCLQAENNLAVLVLKLDRFKEINDSLGHGVGDKLLREVSSLLSGVSGTVDTIAHFGGDEFVLLLETEEIGEAVSLAQRILNILAQPLLIEARELFLFASIGIAMFPKDGEDDITLLKNAAAAVYRAKASGGNNFSFYAAEMNAHSLALLNLENELRHALERDELLLYYQPQLSLRNGEIIGMEALVRWQHPVRGLVSPADFIPLAEATGLIVPIGAWVLRTACAQNQTWLAAGLPAVAVAVNLSARQFEAQDMVALTSQVLRETGLDPNYLELELTESAAMGDADAFVGITEALKGLSVTLSIDDFGTGYSSLSYLKRFALDRLKIDQSFVRDIVQDPDSAAIAVAVIALAHGLGLSVIAEGVETEAQLNFLRTRGCDEMQGYYFSKPLPAAKFEQLLREGRKLALSAADELPCLLLVDDEPAILSALKRLLRREGHPILTATSTQEGLELLANHEVAVVISDQRMPQMTGAEFLAKAREMYPDTVRIILSGYSDLKAITDVVNRGEIYKFLEKPWDDAALLETLREAFRLYEARRNSRLGG
ncbi:MAG: EAL domain-containing protein [Sulfuricellaceae bacterium]|nr:EAL domain-containing protein [Sulfuricellaceae bacterium]